VGLKSCRLIRQSPPTPAALPMRRTLSLLLGSLLSLSVLLMGATPSWAYPFWAQQNYDYPREATGKLADGYPGIGAGYDSMVVGALGLNADAVKAFIKESKPTYPQFEAWIKKQPGVKLDKATIHKLNVSIAGYIHDDNTRKGILSANGLADDGSVLPDAINLNNLDDWYEFHQSVLK